jgi:deoxyribonuclease II
MSLGAMDENGNPVDWWFMYKVAGKATTSKVSGTEYVYFDADTPDSDINFTIAQRKRGGGTVAFQCEALWRSISAILRGVTTHPKKSGGAGGTKAAGSTAASRGRTTAKKK